MSFFMLAAGGTGGHLFPAMALAEELRRRGHAVELMTDHRVSGYGGTFPARQVHIVPSATPSIRNPLKLAGAGFTIAGGTASAWRRLRANPPDAVVSFGGYPTVPPFLAARMIGVPGILHEANAIMGRANRALGRFARALALSFENTIHADEFDVDRVVTGNPVRDRVRAVAALPYLESTEDSTLRILVFGGSQGAKAFADLVPTAIATLPEALRRRLHVTQQARADDLDRVAASYRQARVSVDLAAFFDDLPERMARSQLVISRSGASTVAELCVLGRPAILIPLPGSIDADQKRNAEVIDAAGGGWIAEQATLSPQSLGTRLQSLIGDPGALARAAAAAKSLAQPQAVERLADLAERIARRPQPEDGARP